MSMHFHKPQREPTIRTSTHNNRPLAVSLYLYVSCTDLLNRRMNPWNELMSLQHHTSSFTLCPAPVRAINLSVDQRSLAENPRHPANLLWEEDATFRHSGKAKQTALMIPAPGLWEEEAPAVHAMKGM